MAERSIEETIKEFRAAGWEVHQRSDGSVLLTKSPEPPPVAMMAESAEPGAATKPQGIWREIMKDAIVSFLVGRHE